VGKYKNINRNIRSSHEKFKICWRKEWLKNIQIKEIELILNKSFQYGNGSIQKLGINLKPDFYKMKQADFRILKYWSHQ
jgi:hypothetical protein